MLPSDRYTEPAPGAVLAALHDIQTQHGYLPEDAVRQAAETLGAPLSQVFSAATFYAAFSFEPCGRHILEVCQGTACYVSGSAELLDRLEEDHAMTPDTTTDDGLFTLRQVRCVGSCGLAPVVRVDGETFGRVAPGELDGILQQYRDKR